MRRLLSLAAVALLVFAAIACGGDAPEAMPTLSPPPISPQLQTRSQGSLTLDVAAGGRQAIDPLALARQFGEPPTCADYVFLFSWQTRQKEGISFVGTRQGGAFDIGSGQKGEASVSGCILLEAVNAGDGAVSGEMRYFVAEPRR